MQYTLHQPWGICAGICPFNAPLITFVMKVAPALACGNTIVIKTSEQNPFSTLFMASLPTQAGIPPGVINCLTGGVEAGHALASHMRIRKISFTGSVAVGKLVQQAAAASNLKSATLELGGKSPVVVFPDADIDAAVCGITSFLALNGQGCALGTRVYVHRAIEDEVVAKVREVVNAHGKTLGGDPLVSGTRSSPLYNHRQRGTVLRYIKNGKEEATLLTGGSVVRDKGCYIEPTIFVNPRSNARILKEEIFGPVLTIVAFETEEEVLNMANDSEFGLAASIWTKDIAWALRFSYLLEAGSVNINAAGGVNPKVPTGGWKREYLSKIFILFRCRVFHGQLLTTVCREWSGTRKWKRSDARLDSNEGGLYQRIIFLLGHDTSYH